MPDKPNILILMTDHQRADTVLPEHPAIMPNVERLAREGVTFTQASCPMAHCCPARATFFTGLYPSRSGVWNNVCNDTRLSTGLNPGVRLFSDDLRDAGYDMAFSGKWHVSIEESPKDRGWRELLVSSVAGAHHGQAWEQIRRGAQQPEPVERGEGEMLCPGYGSQVLYGPNDKGNPHDEEATALGCQAIRDFAQQDNPWILYVGPNMPHAPYRVPQRYLDMYDLADVPLPPSYHDTFEDKPNYYRKLRDMKFGQLSEREVRDAIRHFWAMCTYLDELFGQLLTALDETGQADNTLVLYCSDHGDYCGEHGLFHKGVPSFRGAYNVPAVMRWPAGIADPGRRVDELVSTADFAPTFTEVGGTSPSPDLSGASLLPFLRHEAAPEWRDAIFTQCHGVENYFTQRQAVTRDFKYVYNGFDYDELYDLRTDPHEMTNLQAHPDYQEIKHDLVRRMWQFAYQEQDPLATAGVYIMVATAPYGPREAFRP